MIEYNDIQMIMILIMLNIKKNIHDDDDNKMERSRS